MSNRPHIVIPDTTNFVAGMVAQAIRGFGVTAVVEPGSPGLVDLNTEHRTRRIDGIIWCPVVGNPSETGSTGETGDAVSANATHGAGDTGDIRAPADSGRIGVPRTEAERLAVLLAVGCPVVVVDLGGNDRIVRAAAHAGVPVVAADASMALLERTFRDVFLPIGAEAVADRPSGAQPAPRPMLSAREEEILRLYASGMLLKQIAYTTGVSLNTVKSYRARIQAKYAQIGIELRQRLDFHLEARARYGELPIEGRTTKDQGVSATAESKSNVVNIPARSSTTGDGPRTTYPRVSARG